MPTDQLGNPLLVDDLVVVKVGDQMLIAHVKQIIEPSVITPGPHQQQAPGQLILTIPMTTMFNIQNPICGNVVKAIKPPNYGKKAN